MRTGIYIITGVQMALRLVVFCWCFVLPAPTASLYALGTNRTPQEEIYSAHVVSETGTEQDDILELKPGETINSETGPNQKKSYCLKLEAGQTVILTIPRYTAAVVANSFDPGGDQIGYHDQQRPEMIIKPIVLVAEQPGNYRIDVYSHWSGQYSISSSVPHQTTEIDRKHQAAQKLYVDYMIKISGDKNLSVQDKLKKRLEALEERLAIYRTTPDVRAVALSLVNLANHLSFIGEYAKMLDHYREAVGIFRATNNVAEQCEALMAIANDANRRTADYQKAIDHLYQALDISREKGYKYGESRALHQLGSVYNVLGDERKALDFYDQAATVARSVPYSLLAELDKAMTLSIIGSLYADTRGGEGASFSPGTGVAGDARKAIEYFRQALEIHRDLKGKGHRSGMVGEATMLLSIGNALKTLGSYEESLDYLNQCLKLHKDLNYRPGHISVLKSIGNLYVLRGEYQTGFQYNAQAWELQKTDVNTTARAQFLSSVAKDHYRAGETQKALDLYNESLALSRPAQQLGIVGATLFEIARIEREIGNFANARTRIEEAIQIVESVRAKIAVPETRSTYFATIKRYYDFYIDLQMQAHKAQPEKGFDSLALQASEKSRSRGLLDLLALAGVDAKKGVEEPLLDREQQARDRLIERAYKQSALLLGKHTKEEADKINREVTVETDAYQGLQAEIRNKNPRYAALTQPISLNTSQIQQLLDSGTVLLEYSLGDKKSYLWAVTATSIASFDLPGRGEIETIVKRVYELSTARNQQTNGETAEERRLRIKAADLEYPAAAAALTEKLLGPATSQIKNKRLVIVPDGALHYVSFAALPLPAGSAETSSGSPVGSVHEVVSLPSASVLGRLRHEKAGRESGPNMLAVFADPVFSEADARTSTGSRQRSSGRAARKADKDAPSISRDFERAIKDVGLAGGENYGLARLPFSRREAESIFNVSPHRLSLKRTDFNASKSEVFSSGLDQYRTIHFATHALLNSQHPELSGIVLSLVDRNGGAVDGFLRLHDVYNLKLSADLVVLSACSTALGKEIKGEGIIGLTRGFMYAGSPRVVASLWKVDDAATAALMTIFYRKMQVDNLRPAAALRAAQIEMMKQPRWRSPYFWAPFVLHGEWR